MTLYSGPKSLKDPYHQSKFVRVGDQIALGQDGNYKDSHRDIAEKDGLLPELWEMRRTNPDSVDADAGLVFFSGEEIQVTHHSETLGLPPNDEARTRSVTVFEQLSPGYRVEAEMPPAKERR